MRLRLEIRRHGLPLVKILWNTAGLRPGAPGLGYQTTAAQLLEQVNEVVQLEVGVRGLDDYVVEANGYECLHFSILEEILQEDAQITIRPLEFLDHRSRRISGRQQISNDGRHLIDGVAFGRPFVKPSGQPALTNAKATDLDNSGAQLMLPAPDGDDDDDDDDGDDYYQYPGSDEESPGVADDLAELAEEERQVAARLARLQSSALTNGNAHDERPRRKRKHSEGLGIGDAGLSSALLSGESTPDDVLHASKRRATHSSRVIRQRPSLQSPRSSARSVRFAVGEDETPATLRMIESSEDESSTVNSESSSLLSDKENKAPIMKGYAEENTSDCQSTSSTGTSGSHEHLQNSDPYTSSSNDSSSDAHDSDQDTSSEDLSAEDSSSEHSSTYELDPSDDSESLTGSPGSEKVPKAIQSSKAIPKISKSFSKHLASASDEAYKRTVDSCNSLNLNSTAKPNATDHRVVSPSQVKRTVPPGAGLQKTRARNERRALKKRLQRVITAGLLPTGATLQDLRCWCEDLTEQDITTKIENAVEEKRQALLKSIASGGVDASLTVKTLPSAGEKSVSPTNESLPVSSNVVTSQAVTSPLAATDGSVANITKDNADVHGNDHVHECRTEDDPLPKTTTSSTENSPGAAKPGRGRAKLDIAASKRLLFGSLGLKAPLTKKDEDQLREKLTQNVKSASTRQNKPIEPSTSLTSEAAVDDSWKDKVVLSAVECCGQSKRLTTPPFPFVQRWHAKNQRQRVDGVPNNSLAQEDVELRNKDDTYQETVDSQHLKDALPAEDAAKVVEDLPPLPEDLSLCPPLDLPAIRPGAIIAFKQMELSKATNWSPVISGLRTAEIKSVGDDGLILLELAKRDQQATDKEYDPYTGQRVYSGFEAPDIDGDGGEGADIGRLEMEFGEMIEPLLIYPSSDLVSSETQFQGFGDNNPAVEQEGLADLPSHTQTKNHVSGRQPEDVQTPKKSMSSDREATDPSISGRPPSSKTNATSFYTASSAPEREDQSVPADSGPKASQRTPTIEYDSWQPISIDDDGSWLSPSEVIESKPNSPLALKFEVSQGVKPTLNPFDSSPTWPPGKASSVASNSSLRRSTRLRTPVKRGTVSPTRSLDGSSGPPSLGKLLSQPSQPQKRERSAESNGADDDAADSETITVSSTKRRHTSEEKQSNPTRKSARVSAAAQYSSPAANTRNRSKEDAVDLTQLANEESDSEDGPEEQDDTELQSTHTGRMSTRRSTRRPTPRKV